MARFTLRVSLRAFSPEARAAVKVSVTTTPKRYPVPGVGILEEVAPKLTDAEGLVDFDLVSLPNLSYAVAVAGDVVSIVSGDQEDAAIVRLDSVTSIVPSPILPIDAAALRAEVLLAIDEAVAGVTAGQVTWETISDKPTEFPPSAHTHADLATDAELAAGLAGKVDTTDARLSDSRTPVAHVHTEADVTGLAASLAGKSDAGHLHTSAQVTDFVEAVQDAVASLLGAGSNITLNYDDALNTLSVSATGGGGGLDEEAVRDAIGIAMVGVGNVSVAVNDAADTITVSTTATVNATDAALRDRSTHTGEQAISTVTGLQAAIDAKAATAHDHTASQVTDFAEVVLDTVGTALVGVGMMGVAVDDELDTITISTAATANDTNAALRDRTTHTGEQAVSTVTGLQTALDGKSATGHGHAIGDTTGLQTALDTKVASSAVDDMVVITAAAYTALGSGWAAGTLYLIQG